MPQGSSHERVVIIGADAGGMAAVSQIRKGKPDAKVTAFDLGRWSSYSACGIPFFVSGEAGDDVNRLVARSPEKHRETGIDLRMRHQVVGIDVAAREVEVHDLEAGRSFREPFDQLLIGTGGTPRGLDVPGGDLPHVFHAQTLDDALALRALADQHRGDANYRVVVVGAGYIGLEVAEAFCSSGVHTTMISNTEHPIRPLISEFGSALAAMIREAGIDLRCSTTVTGITPDAVLATGPDGDVELPADLVVLGVGTLARSELAKEAGLEIGVAEGIVVDDRMQTSAEGIYAAGDCVQSMHLITGQPVHMALGTYANKQARVAGINMGGGQARFPGVLGTAITRFNEMEIAMTGLNRQWAADSGFDAVELLVRSGTIAGYMPGASKLGISMVAEKGTGRVLGAQIVGGSGAGKRIDTVATAIAARMTVADVVDLDLAYAPPFSPTWDPVAVVARELLKAV